MSNFDLNIQNYTIDDIENFFKLTGNYSKSDIEFKEYQMRNLLLQDKTLSKAIKRDVVVFCTAAKQWLLFSKFGERSIMSSNNEKNEYDRDDFQHPPTTIRNNIDYTQIPLSLSQEIARKDSELIYNNGKPYIFVDNSEFHRGNINPLNSRIVNKCLCIDSKYRDNYQSSTASDFAIQLPSKINNVVSMQLANFAMPLTNYNISSCYGNHYLWIELTTQYYKDGPIEAYSKYIVLPDGMYSATTVVSTLNDLLSPRDLSGNLTDPDNIFSYINFYLDIDEYATGSGRTYIRPAGEKAYIINSIFMDFTKDIEGVPDRVDYKMRLGWNLGFRHQKYGGSLIYKSEAIIDIKTIKYIYLAIEDYQKSVNNLFINAFSTTYVNEHTLARILLGSDDFTILMENSLNLVTEERKYFGPVDLQRLRVQLYDDHGRKLHMNHTDFSFVLNLKILYDA